MTRRSIPFQTSSGRRKADPVQWDIATSGENGLPEVATIRLRAVVSVSTYLDYLDEWVRPMEDYKVDPATGAERTSGGIARAKRAATLDVMARFIIDEDQKLWRSLEDELDGKLLTALQDSIMEVYGGGNPSARSDSPDGSSTTGSSSTDGVPPAE